MPKSILRIILILVSAVLIGGLILYLVWNSYIDPKVSFRNLSSEAVFFTWSTVSTQPRGAEKVAPGEAIRFRPHGDVSFDISVSLRPTKRHCDERESGCYVLKGVFGKEFVFKHADGVINSEYVLRNETKR